MSGTSVVVVRCPDGAVLKEASLEVVLPEKAELAEIEPEVLAPGVLPELWKSQSITTAGLKGLVADERDRRYVEHSTLNLLRQRIYQIAAGYQDANDATCLRHDRLCAVVGRGELPLASQPTLSRLENAVPWESIRALERLGLEWFMRGQGQGQQRRPEIF